MFAPPPTDLKALVALGMELEASSDCEYEDEFSDQVRSQAPPPQDNWWAAS